MRSVNRPLIVIYAAIGLDAVGIGMIFPIVPRLLEDVNLTADISLYVGVMTALYALVQFVCAPALGSLSDVVGRRPVLLTSLAGAAVDYAFMAVAPSLWLLLLGRAIAGLTSANISVATAYITDVTPADDRAAKFGLFGAVFGAGFIIGPVIGGMLGDQWVRLPFVVAAVLNAGNLLVALLLLPESRPRSRRRITPSMLNPLRPLRWALTMKGLPPIVASYFIMSAAGEAYGVCWALWGIDAFRWNGFWIGLSLGAFGLCQMLVQAFLTGPATRRLGERSTVLVGLAAACVAMTVMAFATEGWMVFAIMPVFALTGLGTPALQAIATRRVDEALQGQLQGVLTSATSLSAVFAPLGFSSFYFALREIWPGAVWLSVLALSVLAAPFVILSTRPVRREEINA